MLILNNHILSRLNFCYKTIKQLTQQAKVIFKQYKIKKPLLIIDDANVKIACYYAGYNIIVVNDDILDLNSEAKIKQILTHEFCHHIMYYIDGGKSNHGKKFNEICKIFGIPSGPKLSIRTKQGEKLK